MPEQAGANPRRQPGLIREASDRMSLPKTILVPTDFGEPAEEALDYAVTLAGTLGARIILLNVLRLPVLGMVEMGAVVTEGAMDSLLIANQAELDRLAALRTTVPIETALRTGEAHDVILQVAEEVHADLIVMGTHGRHGIRRLLLGSVAEAIVRTASCPVLTMHSTTSVAA
jgi:nucleotide-binding universal stress UspA family protein